MSRIIEAAVITVALLFSTASYAKTATITSDIESDATSAQSQKKAIQNNSTCAITELNMDNYDPASTAERY